MKKYLFGLFAIAFAAVLSAFTFVSQASSDLFVDEAYIFTGDCSSDADKFNPQKWIKITGSNLEVTCGDPDECICAILVPSTEVYTNGPNADKPKVDVNPVRSEIIAADEAGADDVTGVIKVYLKPE